MRLSRVGSVRECSLNWVVVILTAFGLGLGVAACSDEGSSEGPPPERPRPGGDGPGTGGGAPGSSDAGGTEAPPTATSEGCTAGERRCSDGQTAEVCDGEGSRWVATGCADGEQCADGECSPLEACTAGETRCTGRTTQEECRPDGSGFASSACPAGALCLEGGCRPAECNPGVEVCRQDDVVTCTEDGQFGDVVRSCAAGRCSAGACVEGCVVDDKNYIGCEFFALKLDHMSPGDTLQFAVTVSNVGSSPVEVSITDGEGTELDRRTVAALSLATIELPRRDVIASSRSFNSYRISADGPVTVHQFNPLSRDGVASTDASLLFPSTSFGQEYVVVGWPSVRSGRVSDGRSYVSVVAAEDNTDVTITPTVATVAGAGVTAIAANTSETFTLARGEVLSVGTANEHGLDLTGTRVSATRPVGVHYGSKCADIPLGACCCDHVEQQLIPVDTWGTTVIAPKFRPRGTESDIWRFVAAEDNTSVTLTPPVGGVDSFVLQAGQVREVSSPSSFIAEATGPILAGHFMVGANASGVQASGYCFLGGRAGDPALTLNVGAEQYLTDYMVLTPTGFRENYLSIVARVGTTVEVDGQPVAGTGQRIGTSEWTVHYVEVQPGVHRVSSAQTFGLHAYGYDCAVSYAYPGGLNLEGR